jgi:hypothetical protein
MKFLIDNSKPETFDPLFAGQLLTPLTRYRNWSPSYFAIDNGAFSGFDSAAFAALLKREKPNQSGCLFVCCPDVVGSAARTLDLFRHRERWIDPTWPLAFVAQNGIEDLECPFEEFDCLFIGGDNSFKSAKSTMDLVKTAKLLGKHVHIGRVNCEARFRNFAGIADTCDGSGVSRGLGRHLARIKGGQVGTLFEGMA